MDRPVERRCATDRGRLALSRALPPREEGLDRCLVGPVRQSAPREVLSPHGGRTPPTPQELGHLVNVRSGRRASTERQATAGVMTSPLWRRYLRFFGPDPAADVDDEFAFHL